MRTVHELNENELEELRDTYRQISEEPDVSMEAVFEHYDGVMFTEDDFWCNESEPEPEPKKPRTYTRDELVTITNNMHRFGGGFIKAIAEAISRADQQNLTKLQEAFPEEFEKYLKF